MHSDKHEHLGIVCAYLYKLSSLAIWFLGAQYAWNKMVIAAWNCWGTLPILGYWSEIVIVLKGRHSTGYSQVKWNILHFIKQSWMLPVYNSAVSDLKSLDARAMYFLIVYNMYFCFRNDCVIFTFYLGIIFDKHLVCLLHFGNFLETRLIIPLVKDVCY